MPDYPVLRNGEGFVCDAVALDGTSYLARGGGFTGAADSKTGIVSVFFKTPDSSFNQGITFNGQQTAGDPSSVGLGNTIRLHASSMSGDSYVQCAVTMKNAAKVTILDMGCLHIVPAFSWHHLMAWWDLATGAYGLRFDGDPAVNLLTLTNDTIDYTTLDFFLGAGPYGGFAYDGDLAKFYWAPGQYIDGSDETNLRKFLGTDGKPVILGADGSLPTGVAPLVFLNIADGESAANFATNRGTGGDFTISGSLTTATTSPSD